MKNIPHTQNALLLRTAFSDEAAWEALCKAVQEPVGDFRAQVECFSDPDFDDLPVAQLLSRLPAEYEHTFLFMADRMALTHAQHPVLAVDLSTQPGRTFRVIPAQMWSVENNLSSANRKFVEFARVSDEDESGVFRGFPEAGKRSVGKNTLVVRRQLASLLFIGGVAGVLFGGIHLLSYRSLGADLSLADAGMNLGMGLFALLAGGLMVRGKKLAIFLVSIGLVASIVYSLLAGRGLNLLVLVAGGVFLAATLALWRRGGLS